MSHEGCALVWHVQPRVVIFPCPTHLRPSSVNCRLTNYELLRWLVETPSRDFEHYRMTDDSRSRSRDNWKMSGRRLTCRKMSDERLTCKKCQTDVWHVKKYLMSRTPSREKCQAKRGHEFQPRPVTKSNVIFSTLFLFTFCFVFFLFLFLRFS